MKQRFWVIATILLCLLCGSSEVQAELPKYSKTINGTIQEVRFSDPLKEVPYYKTAEIDVLVNNGRVITIEVTIDTRILDYKWKGENASYLREGKRVRVDYVVTKDRKNVAKKILEKDKP